MVPFRFQTEGARLCALDSCRSFEKTCRGSRLRGMEKKKKIKNSVNTRKPGSGKNEVSG